MVIYRTLSALTRDFITEAVRSKREAFIDFLAYSLVVVKPRSDISFANDNCSVSVVQ